MEDGTVVVKGYRELMRACSVAERAAAREVRDVLREVGDSVKRDAVRRFSAYDSKTAHGYRTVVRARGIAVEQSLRKTTGQRPQWGSVQMRRALLPAMRANEERVYHDLEHALDLVADVFEYGSY